MKKHPFMSFIILIITILVFIVSISFLWPNEGENIFNHDINILEDINGQTLDVTYFERAKINTDIAYGNTYVKKIKIVNNNDEDIVFAINLKDHEVSNELLVYSILASDDDESYQTLFDEQTLENENIGYNIQINSHKTLYLKISFKAMKEGELTNLKGTLQVASNISKKELFIANISKLHQEILKKVDSINGINTAGIYLLSLKNIDTLYVGYVVIDAQDISDLKYIYTLWNDAYLLKNFNYSERKPIVNNLEDKQRDLTSNEVCALYTQKDCHDFNDLKYMEHGGEKNFKIDVEEVLEVAMNDFNTKKRNSVVYIYDINDDLGITKNDLHGYILVDNRSSKANYYLYIHNSLFMITGYNITKYGEIDVDSSTIRVYRDSAFNLSSESYKQVCNFTKLGDCYKLNEEKIN